jgi:hypothetical protein
VILLMGFDPMTYTHQKTPTAPRGAYDPNLVQLNPRPRFGESRVVMTYWAYQRFNRVSIANPLYDFQVKRLGLFANCNLLEGIPKLDGFYSLYLHEPDAIWSIFYFQTNNTWISRSMPPSGERHYVGLLDFLGASFESKAEQHFDWTPRTNYLPLVTAGQVPVFADQTNTLQGLVRPDFDPRRHVFMPPAAKSELPGLEPSNPRISTSPSAQHVSVSIWAERPALIVISQSYYTPWQAYVDDRPARIWKANFAFQAVSIPSGHHVVRFIYRDWKFIAGAILSAIALLYCAGREVGLRCRSPIESSPDT